MIEVYSCLIWNILPFSRVLKPPGGGSSDIFGSAPEETSPRRVKNHNQSQLGSALFGGEGPASNNSNETPRGKPGNDSYNRLFGPPDAPPTTPNAKNHMRSNIPLTGDTSSSCSSSVSPAKSTASSDSIAGVLNGYAASNGNNLTNDVTGKTDLITSSSLLTPRCKGYTGRVT